MTNDGTTEEPTCSFCGKAQHEVAKLIAGPAVYSCDECIRLGYDIVSHEQPERAGAPSPPFARFTERARTAVVEGQQHARELHHDFFGTEHLLLGVVGTADGKLAELFEAHGATTESIRAKVADLVGPSKEPVRAAPPFTPRAMRALQLSGDQASELGSDHVDAEHLLLGMIAEGHGLASQFLVVAGITVDEARALLTAA